MSILGKALSNMMLNFAGVEEGSDTDGSLDVPKPAANRGENLFNLFDDKYQREGHSRRLNRDEPIFEGRNILFQFIRLDSDVLHTEDDEVVVDGGNQKSNEEMELWKKEVEELRISNKKLSEELEAMGKENESLKQQLSVSEQTISNYSQQITRLNKEVSLGMEEKEQLEADLQYFRQVYESTSEKESSSVVTENLRQKIEDVLVLIMNDN